MQQRDDEASRSGEAPRSECEQDWRHIVPFMSCRDITFPR